MSAQPVSSADDPQLTPDAVIDKASTSSHPPPAKPDPTTSTPPATQLRAPTTTAAAAAAVAAAAVPVDDAAQRGVAAAAAPGPAELARLKVILRNGLRTFPDFPSPGILFEDIMPLFASHTLHSGLIRALELQIARAFHTTTGAKSSVDVIVGLESRGFLFGPTLALSLGAGFVPVRKKGKLPGECATETFKKEYGEDVFQMQVDAIQKGQRVVIVDDIIATGGTAAAAGSLVRQLGGQLLGYVFIMELDFLKGREKLDAPAHTLLNGQEESLEETRSPLAANQ